jgi:galactonate dehydratase
MIKHLGTFMDRDKPQNDSQSETMNQYIHICLTAAMKIAAIIRELCEKRRMYSTFSVKDAYFHRSRIRG